MAVSIIAAVSENGVIGRRGELPWRLAEDLRRFKSVTMGKPIVMGRKTFESIGKPLPGRRNIVITRQAGFAAGGCDVVASTDEALAVAGDTAEVMVIGGAEIYSLFLPVATRLYLTRVHAKVDGDTRFPAIRRSDWILVADERNLADERNEFDYSFRTYERRAQS